MVFISYSSLDYDTADRIRTVLTLNHIECWMAPESIPAGGDYASCIPKAIERSDIFLVIISKYSQASVWVPKEMDIAISLRKNVIPIHIDGSEWAGPFKFRLSNVQAVDATAGTDSVAKALVNRIDTSVQVPNASDVSSNLTENITFFELLGVTDSGEINIEKVRREADVTRSLAVPFALNDQGRVVTLDLHHKGDGPNCIFAGPAGAGKSEFIHTYLLALALFFSQEEVRFHVIDIKGCGVTAGLAGLPHLGRCISKDSLKDINSFLTYIRKDMAERKRILAEYEVKNIYQYLKKRKSDKSMPAMPHVFIAFDEFADIKVRFPEFAWHLKKLASEGNADLYGVHLIIATQKVHGVIDASIEEIVTCQICSSMQSGLGLSEPVPSRNRIPGRLYFQSIAQDAVQLVQLAYCGSLVEPNLSNKEELKNYQWFFRKKSQRESLISALVRYSLD